MDVSLREIDRGNVGRVIRLRVRADQQGFVAPTEGSLAEAYVYVEAWVRAIYLGEQPVGFVMLYDETLRDEAPESPEVCVWRLLVDARWQGRGIGAAAMRLVIEHGRSRGAVDALLLSYVPGPGSPEPFYRGLGFEPTGVVEEGEVVLSLSLSEGRD